MRAVMLLAALLISGACNPGSVTTSAASTAATIDATLPEGFPQTDLTARGAECVVYLGLSMQANARPAGRDGPIMQQAADQWRASMRIDGQMREDEIRQLVGSSVNPLSSTSARQRDAASAWCVENAPEPDPDK